MNRDWYFFTLILVMAVMLWAGLTAARMTRGITLGPVLSSPDGLFQQAP